MFAESHYLLANLLGLLPLGATLFLARRLRNTAIVCGVLLCIYCPPVSWLYEGVYWTPDRLFGGAWGIEDLMFCFHAGAMSWICALSPWGAAVEIRAVARVAVRRLLTISLLATVFLLCLLAYGLPVFQSFLVVQTASTIALVLMRPAYARLILSGVPLFTLYYFILLSIWRILMPDFMDMWSGTELTGNLVMGVPVEEYFWVCSFCAGFVVTMAFVLEARFKHLTSKSQPIDAF